MSHLEHDPTLGWTLRTDSTTLGLPAWMLDSMPVLVAMWDGQRSVSVYCDRYPLGADLGAWVEQSWHGLTLGGGVEMGYGHDVAEAVSAYTGALTPVLAASIPLGEGVLTDSDGITLRWQVWPIRECSYSR